MWSTLSSQYLVGPGGSGVSQFTCKFMHMDLTYLEGHVRWLNGRYPDTIYEQETSILLECVQDKFETLHQSYMSPGCRTAQPIDLPGFSQGHSFEQDHEDLFPELGSGKRVVRVKHSRPGHMRAWQLPRTEGYTA